MEKNKINICYIIGQLKRGGAEKQLYELLRGLSRDIFDPSVISLSEGGYWAEEIGKLDIPVIEIPRKKSMEFARLLMVIKLLRTVKPEIVHTYMFSANTYGRVAALATGVPAIIASERNSSEFGKDKGRVDIIFDKVLARFSDAIICNTRHAARCLIEEYSFNATKVFAIHNGINPPDHASKEPQFKEYAKSYDRIIGTVGRMVPQKNHRLFLDMAKVIVSTYPKKKIGFLLVGDGPLRYYLSCYARALGIENSVIFAGERSDVPRLLRSMDIFVMTSEYEGLSNAIMEAMLAGLPVVATDVGGNCELISDGETGFLCCTEAAAIADKVISLLENEEKMNELGKNARTLILDQFGIEKMVKATENIYFSLLQKTSLNDPAGRSRQHIIRETAQ